MTLNVAIIGLDSSHSVEFCRRLQSPDCSPELRVAGMKVVRCVRMPSPFRSESHQDLWQTRLESWGVEVTRRMEDAGEDVDAFMVLNTDPAAHWPSMQGIAGLGKPVYLDKPPADTPANARAIGRLISEHGLRIFSASALRFAPELTALRSRLRDRQAVRCVGALDAAAAGSSIVWYGIHAVEMLQQVVGIGAKSLSAHQDERGILVDLRHGDGRRATIQLNRGDSHYTAFPEGEDSREFLPINFEPLYTILLNRMLAFFGGGTPPVSWEQSLEAQDILDAIERSLEAGAEVPVTP